MLNRQKAIELLNSKSCAVKVGSLDVPNGIGIFITQGKITEYNTIFLKELNYYEWIERIFEINGEEVNWRY